MCTVGWRQFMVCIPLCSLTDCFNCLQIHEEENIITSGFQHPVIRNGFRCATGDLKLNKYRRLKSGIKELLKWELSKALSSIVKSCQIPHWWYSHQAQKTSPLPNNGRLLAIINHQSTLIDYFAHACFHAIWMKQSTGGLDINVDPVKQI